MSGLSAKFNSLYSRELIEHICEECGVESLEELSPEELAMALEELKDWLEPPDVRTTEQQQEDDDSV